jgi:hypothetical protein
MPAKLKKRAGKAAEALDRPFAPEVLERARKFAKRYRIVLEPEAECGYVGSSLEMPNVYADGARPTRP